MDPTSPDPDLDFFTHPGSRIRIRNSDFISGYERQLLTYIGDDLEGLLFHFLDEWLFIFSADDFFIPRKIVITEFDQENFKITSTGFGEQFDLSKHPQVRIIANFFLPLNIFVD
jgi:hypothetical protein